jgi:hypothetical protein
MLIKGLIGFGFLLLWRGFDDFCCVKFVQRWFCNNRMGEKWLEVKKGKGQVVYLANGDKPLEPFPILLLLKP